MSFNIEIIIDYLFKVAKVTSRQCSGAILMFVFTVKTEALTKIHFGKLIN